MNVDKEQGKLISIVVPVYNVERYLTKCIDSILGQTYKNLEIILVDDGSTDYSGKICDEYALKDLRVKVIHKENGGLVSARQAGINIASGEYIGFVDSDDWIEQDMYQTLYHIAIRENADIVVEGVIDDFGGKCSIVLNRFPVGKYATLDERKKLFENMICCEDFFCLGIQPYLWNKLFRRELILRHLNKIPQLIRVGEDAAATYPLLIMAKSIVISNTVHYHYCHHENSMMLGNIDENQEYDNAILLNSFLKKSFMELGIYGIVKKQLHRYTINNLMVRAYGKIAALDENSDLFLFGGIHDGDSIIIYGAGALGRAIYRYAISCGRVDVRALIDQGAERYRMLGLDVRDPDEVVIEDSDMVIVAVFSKSAYRAIYENLINKGVKPEQIQWIDDKNCGMIHDF